MNKVAHYLQEHVVGEVMTSADARKYFSTDTSIFSVTPAVVLYPQNENDVRKTARFAWQLAERGRVLPITARGAGSDQTGAAIGNGICMVFPAHMNRILELDGRSGIVAIEPGINYGKLQQTLHTHGRFLPPYPSSIEFTTVGGAIANNASGEKTVKYGDTRKYVRGLRVVLANGEVIETKPLNKRELNKKMGLSSFEGEVYRALDKLIEENSKLIKNLPLPVSKNAAGYDLASVKTKEGFDLTPLIVGSQGTLGIVTEALVGTEAYNPKTTLVAAFCDSLDVANIIVQDLKKLPLKPSAVEVVDKYLLELVNSINPNHLKGVLDKNLPAIALLIEFDDVQERTRKKLAKRVIKTLNKHAVHYQLETEDEAKEKLWKLRHSAALVVSHGEGSKKPLPIIEDGVVPVEKFAEYLEQVYKLFERYNLKAAVWGHAGDANLHMQPFFDLSELGDRQKVFKLMDEYYKLVIELGGSTSGEHNDGRLRGLYLSALYGQEAYNLFAKVKEVFDPYGILNPGVKIGATLENVRPYLRHEYEINTFFEHLPRN